MKKIHMAWATLEGWNPGIYDYRIFYDSDPDGFLVCTIDDAPIACISLVIYSDEYAFLGYYIVAPKYRHQGYGLHIWHAAMERAGLRHVGLDGLVEEQSNYKKSGFEFYFTSARYDLTRQPREHKKDNQDIALINPLQYDKKALLKYDAKHAGTYRERLLSLLLSQPDTFSLVAVSKKSKEIVGFGLIRSAVCGYHCGPLFSNSLYIAQCLFEGLCANVAISEKSPVSLFSPESNQDAQTFLKTYHMKRISECARMVKPSSLGSKPAQLPINNIFGLTSWELG